MTHEGKREWLWEKWFIEALMLMGSEMVKLN